MVSMNQLNYELLRSHQAGFRKNRNCLDQINILRRVTETYYKCQPPLKAVFIDFKMALGSIDREMMWKILRNYGIPKKIVIAIAVFYSSSKSKVRLGEKLSEVFTLQLVLYQVTFLLLSYSLFSWTKS